MQVAQRKKCLTKCAGCGIMDNLGRDDGQRPIEGAAVDNKKSAMISHSTFLSFYCFNPKALLK